MKKFFSSELFKNLKDKSKNYGFWVSLISAIIMLLQSLGAVVTGENEIISGICSVLIMLGIISNPNSGHGYIDKPCNKEITSQEKSAKDEKIGNTNENTVDNTDNNTENLPKEKCNK